MLILANLLVVAGLLWGIFSSLLVTFLPLVPSIVSWIRYLFSLFLGRPRARGLNIPRAPESPDHLAVLAALTRIAERIEGSTKVQQTILQRHDYHSRINSLVQGMDRLVDTQSELQSEMRMLRIGADHILDSLRMTAVCLDEMKDRTAEHHIETCRTLSAMSDQLAQLTNSADAHRIARGLALQHGTDVHVAVTSGVDRLSEELPQSIHEEESEDLSVGTDLQDSA
ncbi:uncharacterized protein GGS22DRAFT_186910 [Annulohypoxylon maeteangense]|uniref:uncharacterized protein n=1 Tax=Annulohypoxylon maeteangense TaxID=1927788 RepID=UPI0020084D3F|nr:uncharacterized protein GGS22DRAFT_186910 [Annulohypoxylon maeteangense]KAI0886836.1 hypothetical protein GGS22DRAFT_186910 [Annulohypoxylon maeteangense]